MILRTLSCALIGLAIVVGGCTSKQMIKPDIKKIDEYIKNHPDLNELDKSCIYDGRFEVGIRDSTVYFLLGTPDRAQIVHQPWATQENWIYNRGQKMTFIIEDKYVVGIPQEDK